MYLLDLNRVTDGPAVPVIVISAKLAAKLRKRSHLSDAIVKV